ncbi:MAG: polysaccharide deacetylase family protein [Smithella sp.]|jgi:polysaccharide deacetylase family protein (PEP-CTERM system associated)
MMSFDNAVGFLSVDVEEWFHILDDPAVPSLPNWAGLESRLPHNIECILSILDEHKVTATMFWLGWAAEKYPALVRRCADGGHEIASHGYAHVLAYEVGRYKFREDLRHGKKIIEDIIGKEVFGFRAAGFGTTTDTPWIFEEIREAGYLYDSSVFPAKRGHGGIADFRMEPHKINTAKGVLLEIPQSVVEVYGRRISFFGGGYLRIAPIFLIKWGINKFQKSGLPLVVYVHPREVDPEHPRLPLKLHRRFKSYVNLKSTIPKLHWLCENYRFELMKDYVKQFNVQGSRLRTVNS